MTIGERVQADIVMAMKARDEHRLSTLQKLKSACNLLILNSGQRDGIEPSAPAFQSPTNGPKWLGISGPK